MTFDRRLGAAAVAIGLTLSAWSGSAIAQEPNDPTPGRDGPPNAPPRRPGRGSIRSSAASARISGTSPTRSSNDSHRARRSVDDLGVEARVYGRLHWDKALNEAEIVVEVQNGGVVVLHGAVLDEEARDKAVALAVETVGVERVIDMLTPATGGRTEAARP